MNVYTQAKKRLKSERLCDQIKDLQSSLEKRNSMNTETQLLFASLKEKLELLTSTSKWGRPKSEALEIVEKLQKIVESR